MANSISVFYARQRSAFCLALVAGLCFLATAVPARADDGPFEFDRAHWMSFDRYKEKTKHGAALQETNDTEASAPAGDNDKPADAPVAGDNATPSVTPPGMVPAMAVPTRPINIPVMPGLNKGYNVQVNSTEDEKPPIAQITHIDTQPTVSIPERNWQAPKDAIRRSGQQDVEGGDGDNERQPLNIRMSFLPNSKITPVPSPEYKSNHGRKLAAAVAAAAPEPEKKAEVAACAAIDAYKKKQLEAIESDRQTLTALQKAISQMGLQKELNFIAGANGAVNQADSSTAKMDMPPSLAQPVKN